MNHIRRLVGATGAVAFAHITYKKYIENQARL